MSCDPDALGTYQEHHYVLAGAQPLMHALVLLQLDRLSSGDLIDLLQQLKLTGIFLMPGLQLFVIFVDSFTLHSLNVIALLAFVSVSVPIFTDHFTSSDTWILGHFWVACVDHCMVVQVDALETSA